jgi:hypothetical protein
MPNENKEQQKASDATVNPAARYLTMQQKAAEWNKEWQDIDKAEDWPNVLADGCEKAAVWELRWGDKVGVRHNQPITLYGFLYAYLLGKGLERKEAAAALAEALEEAGVEQGAVCDTKLKFPPVVFVPGRSPNWQVQDKDGTYSPKSTGLLDDILEHCGMSALRVNGLQSEIGKFRAETCMTVKADWAGPLAGWRIGLHDVNGSKILVTRTYKLLEPKRGNWNLVRAILLEMLGPVQLPYFHAAGKLYYEQLRDGRSQPGQGIILCGPTDCFKSYVQHHILTPVWGGRSADAFLHTTGKTTFNLDLAKAEHLFFDDAKPFGNWLSKHDFAESLKPLIVGKLFPVHPKGIDQIHLPVKQRVSMSLNDDETALRSMPEISASFGDKIHLFKCSPPKSPFPNNTPEERQVFDELVADQLPHYIEWLLRWRIPAKIAGQRFGVKAYHNPELIKRLEELSDETRLLELVDAARLLPTVTSAALDAKQVWLRTGDDEEKENRRKWMANTDMWASTAAELAVALEDSRVKREAEKLLNFKGACGTLLGRLQARKNERVRSYRPEGSSTVWFVSLALNGDDHVDVAEN